MGPSKSDLQYGFIIIVLLTIFLYNFFAYFVPWVIMFIKLGKDSRSVLKELKKRNDLNKPYKMETNDLIPSSKSTQSHVAKKSETGFVLKYKTTNMSKSDAVIKEIPIRAFSGDNTAHIDGITNAPDLDRNLYAQPATKFPPVKNQVRESFTSVRQRQDVEFLKQVEKDRKRLADAKREALERDIARDREAQAIAQVAFENIILIFIFLVCI